MFGNKTYMLKVLKSSLQKCNHFITAHHYLFSFFFFRDTTISNIAEVTSRYHFAAHMGQLISGVDGNGCHNFYPTCPFPGLQVLQMMKKVRMR